MTSGPRDFFVGEFGEFGVFGVFGVFGGFGGYLKMGVIR